MISKELLSKVLGYEVTNISHNGYTDGKIGRKFMFHINPKQRADRPSSCVIPKESINIHELAHLCKQWAFKNGYWLSVRLYEPNGFNIVIFSHIHSQLQKDLKEINDKTEPEVIFKACEWICDDIN